MVYKHISIGDVNQVLIKTQEVYKCKKKICTQMEFRNCRNSQIGAQLVNFFNSCGFVLQR